MSTLDLAECIVKHICERYGQEVKRVIHEPCAHDGISIFPTETLQLNIVQIQGIAQIIRAFEEVNILSQLRIRAIYYHEKMILRID